MIQGIHTKILILVLCSRSVFQSKNNKATSNETFISENNNN